MMSNNRAEYGSASEWLSTLRQDYAWLSQLEQLKASTADDLTTHRDAALRRIDNGMTFEYWEIFQHKVEPVVEEVWAIAELTLPKLKIQTIGMLSMEWIEQHSCDAKNVPEALKSEEAQNLKKKLVDANLLTEDWQAPKKLSGPERALMARAICEYLEIKNVWQMFGRLWNENPETLRSYSNKAFDQKKTLEFQDKLKNILD